jgi:magnesium chelatase family protein
MISRVNAQTLYPAKFQLIAAMNPCPCGYLGSSRCVCGIDQITRYQHKISGPLLDRIDLQVQVSAITNEQLLSQESTAKGETNQKIQSRVCTARHIQIERQGKINTDLSSQELQQVCPLNKEQKSLMNLAIDQFSLSTRGFYRVLKVARSLADLEKSSYPELSHYQEALSYRPTMDRRTGD